MRGRLAGLDIQCCLLTLTLSPVLPLVFETELVEIQGMPKPESIKYKETESATEEPGAAEKIASVVAEAKDAAMTMAADTDDVEGGHEEL